jgi:segregation and condensation protein B
LPPLSELKDIGELEPQLQFDRNDPATAGMALGDLAVEGNGIDSGSDAADHTPSIDMDEPEAAPGERAADENDIAPDNAVETTTVPELEAASDDRPEQQQND